MCFVFSLATENEPVDAVLATPVSAPNAVEPAAVSASVSSVSEAVDPAEVAAPSVDSSSKNSSYTLSGHIPRRFHEVTPSACKKTQTKCEGMQ